MSEACNTMASGSVAEGLNGKAVKAQEGVGIEGRVLASGFDSLELSLYITWRDDGFFKLLSRLRADAAACGSPVPGVIESEGDSWIFNVNGYGSKGFAFLLNSADFDIKLLASMRPKQRPSAVITIRSATLWQKGVIESIDRILTLLKSQGAIFDKAMSSRVDPCMDILVRESIWTPEMMKHAVKRASRVTNYSDDDLMTGVHIGTGNILVRMYDKPEEIATKSKKYWMYDIWELKEVPAGCRVIRIEFQLRREALTELGIDSIWQLTNYARNLWAYCTQKWLKFQDRADLHHTQQQTLLWWSTVQGGFLGGQRECPLIRAKIVNANKVQMAQQLMGQLTSLVALDSDGDITPGGEVEQIVQLSKVIESAELIGMDSFKFHERVRRKIAKYVQAVTKFKAAEEQRKALNFPVMRKGECEKGGAA